MLPVTLFGIMLENMLIAPLGVFFTLVVCSVAMVAVLGLLYISFDLISVDLFKKRIGKQSFNA